MLTRCPECSSEYEVEQEIIGSEIECAECNNVFTARQRLTLKTVAVQKPANLYKDDDDDEEWGTTEIKEPVVHNKDAGEWNEELESAPFGKSVFFILSQSVASIILGALVLVIGGIASYFVHISLMPVFVLITLALVYEAGLTIGLFVATQLFGPKYITPKMARRITMRLGKWDLAIPVLFTFIAICALIAGGKFIPILMGVGAIVGFIYLFIFPIIHIIVQIIIYAKLFEKNFIQAWIMGIIQNIIGLFVGGVGLGCMALILLFGIMPKLMEKQNFAEMQPNDVIGINNIKFSHKNTNNEPSFFDTNNSKSISIDDKYKYKSSWINNKDFKDNERIKLESNNSDFIEFYYLGKSSDEANQYYKGKDGIKYGFKNLTDKDIRSVYYILKINDIEVGWITYGSKLKALKSSGVSSQDIPNDKLSTFNHSQMSIQIGSIIFENGGMIKFDEKTGQMFTLSDEFILSKFSFINNCNSLQRTQNFNTSEWKEILGKSKNLRDTQKTIFRVTTNEDYKDLPIQIKGGLLATFNPEDSEGSFQSVKSGDFVILYHTSKKTNPLIITTNRHKEIAISIKSLPKGKIGLLGDLILSPSYKNYLGALTIKIKNSINSKKLKTFIYAPLIVGSSYGEKLGFNPQLVASSGLIAPRKYKTYLPGFDNVKSRWDIEIKKKQMTTIVLEIKGEKNVVKISETYSNIKLPVTSTIIKEKEPAQVADEELAQVADEEPAQVAKNKVIRVAFKLSEISVAEKIKTALNFTSKTNPDWIQVKNKKLVPLWKKLEDLDGVFVLKTALKQRTGSYLKVTGDIKFAGQAYFNDETKKFCSVEENFAKSAKSLIIHYDNNKYSFYKNGEISPFYELSGIIAKSPHFFIKGNIKTSEFGNKKFQDIK